MDPAKAAYDAFQKFWQDQNPVTKHGHTPRASWDELRPIDRDAWRVATIAADLHRAQIDCETLPDAIERITRQPTAKADDPLIKNEIAHGRWPMTSPRWDDKP